MQALIDLAKKIQALDNTKLFRMLMGNETARAIIIQLLKERQLQEGVDGLDQQLPLYVTDDKGLLGQPYNLFDTGEFYESIDITNITDSEAIIEADTEKPNVDLMEYGAILTLNEGTLQEIIDKTLPLLREEILLEVLQ